MFVTWQNTNQNGNDCAAGEHNGCDSGDMNSALNRSAKVSRLLDLHMLIRLKHSLL